jgi:hypothetical protein
LLPCLQGGVEIALLSTWPCGAQIQGQPSWAER